MKVKEVVGNLRKAERENAQGDLLRCEEAAQRLRVSEDTLASWRRLGRGPVFVRFGHLGRVRYRSADIEAWLIVQEVVPARSFGSGGRSDGESGAGLRAARGAS